MQTIRLQADAPPGLPDGISNRCKRPSLPHRPGEDTVGDKEVQSPSLVLHFRNDTRVFGTISRAKTTGSTSPNWRGNGGAQHLDALEQRREEAGLLAVALNLQPPGVHGPVQRQTSIDEQDIIPCAAVERHVSDAVSRRPKMKTLLAHQYILP